MKTSELTIGQEFKLYGKNTITVEKLTDKRIKTSDQCLMISKKRFINLVNVGIYTKI